MLKIIGYLGIAGLGFFIFSLMSTLGFPFHILKSSIVYLKVCLYVFYLVFFLLACENFNRIQNKFEKVFSIFLFFISIFGVLLMTLLLYE